MSRDLSDPILSLVAVVTPAIAVHQTRWPKIVPTPVQVVYHCRNESPLVEKMVTELDLDHCGDIEAWSISNRYRKFHFKIAVAASPGAKKQPSME